MKKSQLEARKEELTAKIKKEHQKMAKLEDKTMKLKKELNSLMPKHPDDRARTEIFYLTVHLIKTQVNLNQSCSGKELMIHKHRLIMIQRNLREHQEEWGYLVPLQSDMEIMVNKLMGECKKLIRKMKAA